MYVGAFFKKGENPSSKNWLIWPRNKKLQPHLTARVFLREDVHYTCLFLGRTQKVPSYGLGPMASSPQPISTSQKQQGVVERTQAWEKYLGSSSTFASANLCDLQQVTNSILISLSLNKGKKWVSRSFGIFIQIIFIEYLQCSRYFLGVRGIAINTKD